jgi:hypothetical protein
MEVEYRVMPKSEDTIVGTEDIRGRANSQRSGAGSASGFPQLQLMDSITAIGPRRSGRIRLEFLTSYRLRLISRYKGHGQRMLEFPNMSSSLYPSFQKPLR